MVSKYFSIAVMFINLKPLVISEEDKKCTCVDMNMETFKPCKDWEEAAVKMNVNMTVRDDHGIVEGYFDVKKAIEESTELELMIYLVTPNGEELVFSQVADICESLKDETAAWKDFVEVFGTKECPIPKGKYEFKGVTLNLAGLKSLMHPDFEGLYTIRITVEKLVEKVLCFLLGIEIFTEQRSLDDCRYPQNDCF